MPNALTERQLEVVRLVYAGLSNAEIGDELGISPRTAKAHTDVIRLKLGVDSRRRIPAAAIAAGYDVLPAVSP